MAVGNDLIMKLGRSHIGRSPIFNDRLRRIDGGFCFIPHRFLREGFFVSLSHYELLLYFLLVLAGDRNGISFYGCDSICSVLALELDEYILARNGLIAKDLIAFDGTRFQVLSLPKWPLQKASKALLTQQDFENQDPATVRHILQRDLGLIDEKTNENT